MSNKDCEINSVDADLSADTRALAELIGLASRLNEARSLENLLHNFARGLADVWPGAGVRLCEIDRKAGYLIPLETFGADPIPMKGSLLGNTATDNICTIVKDLDGDPAYIRGREAPPGLRWKSAAVCPIPVDMKPEYIVAVFLTSNSDIRKNDAVLLQRAVTLLYPLIRRWKSQEIQIGAFLGIARSLAGAVDARDPYCIGHGNRVSEFAQATAKIHGLEYNYIERLGIAGLLHDIGRLGIPESILLKPDILTPEEMRIVRAHPELSVNFIERVDYLRDTFDAIRHHHEKYSGDGYPDGLEGENIPLGARILAVCDAFDAMTSPRPYRMAMSDRDALEELIVNTGTQFDPIIVEAFTRAYEEKLIISQNILQADDPLASLRKLDYQ